MKKYLILLLCLFSIHAFSQKIDMDLFKNLEPRAFYVGKNKPWSASISYFISELTEDEEEQVKIEVLDRENIVRTLFRKPEKGFNRQYWNLETDGVRRPGGKKQKKENVQLPSGRSVLPNNYKIRISYGESSKEEDINVKLDPRLQISEQELQAKADLMDEVKELVSTTTDLVDRLDESKETVAIIKKMSKSQEIELLDSLNDRSDEITKEIKDLRATIMGPTDIQGIYRDPDLTNSKISVAGGLIRSILAPVTANQRVGFDEASKQVKISAEEINTFYSTKWKDYRSFAESLNIGFFK